MHCPLGARKVNAWQACHMEIAEIKPVPHRSHEIQHNVRVDDLLSHHLEQRVDIRVLPCVCG